jgi:hypothetical protein
MNWDRTEADWDQRQDAPLTGVASIRNDLIVK